MVGGPYRQRARVCLWLMCGSVSLPDVPGVFVPALSLRLGRPAWRGGNHRWGAGGGGGCSGLLRGGDAQCCALPVAKRRGRSVRARLDVHSARARLGAVCRWLDRGSLSVVA